GATASTPQARRPSVDTTRGPPLRERHERLATFSCEARRGPYAACASRRIPMTSRNPITVRAAHSERVGISATGAAKVAEAPRPTGDRHCWAVIGSVVSCADLVLAAAFEGWATAKFAMMRVWPGPSTSV